MNRELFFPTAIYIAELQDLNLNPELEKNIIAWSNKDKGLSRTNIDGWHSQTNMNELPEYKKLVDVLYEAQRTIYEQEHLDSEPYLGNMWANINPPGGMNRAHMHPNALWSGKAPSRLWRETHYEPIAGRLIMFPAWLDHCVDPNKSNENRISVSFNFMQKCFVSAGA